MWNVTVTVDDSPGTMDEPAPNFVKAILPGEAVMVSDDAVAATEPLIINSTVAPAAVEELLT
jgi:hypothetical protein